MSSRRIAFVDARLIDPATRLDAKGALLIEDGLIADLGPDLFADGVPDGIETVACGGHCLGPGLVDMRVHLREPGEEHMENFESAARAAVAGGVTSMACRPDTSPPIDDIALIEFVQRRARQVALTRIYPYAAATKGLAGKELSEMGLLSAAGAVGFFDGDHAIADAVVLRRALTYARMFDQMIMQHPEEPSLASGATATEGELTTRLGLPGMPAVAEVIMIERDLRLVELTDGRYHAAHVSTASAIDAIRQAKRRGLRVTCDTAPPYFTLNESSIGDYRTFAKLSPPLRAESDRKAVVAGLADGTIDAIASDHAPLDQESKRLPYAQAAAGIVGLETLLPLTLEPVHNGFLDLIDALDLVTRRPADILKLPAGRLAPGRAADLLLFDPDRPRRIEVDRFRSKSKNSPYDGRPVEGVVLRTVIGGRTVYSADA